MEQEATMLRLGDSLLVPSVQELAKSSPSTVPLRYVRPNQDPPFQFIDTSPQIPVIDLHKLLFSNNSQDSELHNLHLACKDWGFFQLINHGVSDALVENMKSGVEALFNLPLEQKRKLWQKPGDFEGFGQSFVFSEEQKLNWGDLFGMFILPAYLRKPHLFPNLPLPFRDDLDAYALEMEILAMKLLDLMAKALKMEGCEMRELLGEGIVSTRMNYYPPCPQPELAIGLNNHSDASALTILLQVNEMEGLQIRKDGRWIPVKPLPNAFVLNIGDILEIVTNGIYRSIEHRVTVNSEKERLSVAIFYSPRLDGEIGPAPSLVSSDSPALFKRIGVTDFLKGFFSKELNGKSYLDGDHSAKFMESKTEKVVFGASIIVPSVLELTKHPISKLPLRYERDDQDPPIVFNGDSEPSVPVVDLHRLAIGDFAATEMEKLHSACKEWGFFQIINHGVPTSLVNEFRMEIGSFFNLPYEEKKLLWQSRENQEGFGQLCVVSEDQKLDWSDMFYILIRPPNLRKPHLFHNLPPKLREALEAYTTEVQKLAMIILNHLAEALKMDGEEMRELFRDGVQSMRMNYYPPCPEPDKAIGFSAHSDANALTILLQLNETEGLQIRKDGRWVSVKPVPNAFVVNIGNIIEIVSNGVYKSIEHRVTSNCSKERLSVATFHSPNLSLELGPAKSVVGPHNPPKFRTVPLVKYFKGYFAKKVEGKSYLDQIRIQNQ